jgi:hypothetical protein
LDFVDGGFSNLGESGCPYPFSPTIKNCVSSFRLKLKIRDDDIAYGVDRPAMAIDIGKI